MEQKLKVVYISDSGMQNIDHVFDIFARHGIEAIRINRASRPLEMIRKEVSQAIQEGGKILVCSHRLADDLRAAFELPVVVLRRTYHSYRDALRQARELDKRFALVLMRSGETRSVRQFISDYQNEIKVFWGDDAQINNKEFRDNLWRKILEQIQAEGFRVVLGSPPMKPMAEAMGLTMIPIYYDVQAILQAVEDVFEQNRLYYEQRVRYDNAKAMLSIINEGIVAVDAEGKLLGTNSRAESVLHLDPKAIRQGIYLQDAVPDQTILRALQEQEPVENHILSLYGTELIVNSAKAFFRESQQDGWVLTFQDIGSIRNLNREIRSRTAKSSFYAKSSFSDIIGRSPALNQAMFEAKRFAATDSTVLLQGETGTGKEIFAQSIHNSSPRSKMPFAAINCAALPESLLDSELFGYVKGAFTGARPEGKAGIFELAHKGTIFLDEIGEMPLPMQAKLLRVLQEREVYRLGDDKATRVDVRVVAASNRDLWEEVKEGRFRQDLYYRLCVLELCLPPLRERGEDILLLLRTYLDQRGRRDLSISPEAAEVFLHYGWPGNIRELVNTSERLCVLTDTDTITAAIARESLVRYHDRISAGSAAGAGEKTPAPAPKEPGGELSCEEIERVLRECGGNRSRAAEMLGINRSTLWRRMKQREQQ